MAKEKKDDHGKLQVIFQKRGGGDSWKVAGRS